MPFAENMLALAFAGLAMRCAVRLVAFWVARAHFRKARAVEDTGPLELVTIRYNYTRALAGGYTPARFYLITYHKKLTAGHRGDGRRCVFEDRHMAQEIKQAASEGCASAMHFLSTYYDLLENAAGKKQPELAAKYNSKATFWLREAVRRDPLGDALVAFLERLQWMSKDVKASRLNYWMAIHAAHAAGDHRRVLSHAESYRRIWRDDECLDDECLDDKSRVHYALAVAHRSLGQHSKSLHYFKLAAVPRPEPVGPFLLKFPCTEYFLALQELRIAR